MIAARPTSRPDEKRIAVAATVLVLGAVLWPIRQNWRAHKIDGFPLSYYPMFSAKRADRVRVYYLLGLTAAGERRVVPYRYCGTGGLNQVRRQLRRLVCSGKAAKVCDSAAQRVALATDGALADVVTVRAVRGEYRLDDYFAGDKSPLSERVYASSPVERSA